MKQSLEIRIMEMVELAAELESGHATWENKCGYVLNSELLPLLNLSEEIEYV